MSELVANKKQEACACWTRTLAWDFVLPFGLVVLLTLFMAMGDRELAWHKTLYDLDQQSWIYGDAGFWKFLYRASSIPALIVVILAAALYVGSFKLRSWGPYRRVSLYLILLVAVAPGLLVNLIFKEHWGRPRPREITDFGGRYAFESVLDPDPESEGKSFPCGHATMAFYFMAGWFIFRRRRRGWAFVFLLAGLGFGAVVGYMRMLQGGHFATDVLWAGAMTYFTAAGLFYLMGLSQELLPDPFLGREGRRRIPLGVKLGGGFVILGMVAAVLVATPYEADRERVAHYDSAGEKNLRVTFSTYVGDVYFVEGDVFSIKGKVFGHGVPTAGITESWREEDDRERYVLRYKQRLSGWFSEIGQQLKVTVPWKRVESFLLDAGPGKIIFELPRPGQAQTIRLDVDAECELELRLAEDAVLWLPDPQWLQIDNAQVPVEAVRLGGQRPRVSSLITLKKNGEDPVGDGKKVKVKIVAAVR